MMMRKISLLIVAYLYPCIGICVLIPLTTKEAASSTRDRNQLAIKMQHLNWASAAEWAEQRGFLKEAWPDVC